VADRKDRMALLSRYNKLHLQRYEQKSNLNLNACYDLLDYYFEVSQTPSWNFFAYNAQEIMNGREATEKDLLERAERRKLARKWLSE